MLLQTMRHKKIVCIVECNRKNNKITKNEKEEQYKNNFLVGNQKKNINSLNMPSNHKSLSTIVKLNDVDQGITIAVIANNIVIQSIYWTSKGFVVNSKACLFHQKVDDENHFDIVASDVEHRIAFIQLGNYDSDSKKKKKGSSLVYRSLGIQRAGAFSVVTICDDGVNNTR